MKRHFKNLKLTYKKCNDGHMFLIEMNDMLHFSVHFKKNVYVVRE
jgi:hypothetical protein